MSDTDSLRNLISSDTSDDNGSSDEQEELSSATNSREASDCSTKFGSVKMTVVKDEIGRQATDVIVNTTSTDLKLNAGGVSKGLLTVAGNDLQNECNTKYPDGISYGDIAITGPAKLQCKEVYHVCCKAWSGEQTRQELKKLVTKCLSQASSSGHTSISFPALGTGLNKYPRETVAKTMFSCIERFQKEHNETSVVDVRCVIYPADTTAMKAFTERCRKNIVDTSDREICVVPIQNMSVHLIVGNIAEQNHDVLVTTSTRSIKMKDGRLSHYVLDVAGPNLQTEVAEKYPRGIQHGEIAVLSPGGLPSKHLYCGALPRHDRPPEGSELPEVLLRRLVMTCLNQAIKDGAKSVCFPTIGTGYLMYSPEVSAKNMLQAIKEFAINNPETSVVVCIVLHNRAESLGKHLKVFERICNENKVEKPKATPRKTPPLSLVKQRPVSTKTPPPVKPKPTSRLQSLTKISTPKTVVRSTGRSDRKTTDCSDQIGGATAKPVAIPARNTHEFCLYMYGCDITPPLYWTKYTSNKTIKAWKIEERGKPGYILLDVDNATFNMVDKLVQRTWEVDKVGHGRDAAGLNRTDYNRLKVVKVQRIENLTLYESYKHMQQHLFHKAGEGPLFTPLSKIQGVKIGEPATFNEMDPAMKTTFYTEVNEGYFFHGSRRDRTDAKIKEGLDPRLANPGAVFGQAVYMSESSTKADQYTDDRNKRETQGLTMLLVRCTLGEICLLKDTKKLTRPPCKDSSCCSDTCTHEDRYNSVVEEGKYIFREFCVYDKQQVYPDYVITYDRVKV